MIYFLEMDKVSVIEFLVPSFRALLGPSGWKIPSSKSQLLLIDFNGSMQVDLLGTADDGTNATSIWESLAVNSDVVSQGYDLYMKWMVFSINFVH